VCLSGSTSKDNFTLRTAPHLSTTTGLRVGGFKKHPRVIWGVIVSIYIIIVHGEAVRSRAAVMKVKDNEVDYLLTHLAFRVTIIRDPSDTQPRHQPNVGHLKRI